MARGCRYPLLLHGKLIGVLAVFSHQDFSQPSLDAMAAVADGVALAVDRTRAEREVARYTRDLERAHDLQRQNAEQLRALVDELRVTQKQAEAATRAKSEFLASMSHELRTPLNAIILYSELLQEEATDRKQTTAIPDLQRIQGAGKHLLELINGILDLSKIEAGKMSLSLESIDVPSMIGDVLDTLGPIVRQNRNALTVRCSPAVGLMFADRMKTRQILLNLLSNAAKFTKDGAITLDVAPRQRRRHDARGDRQDLRSVHAGRRQHDAEVRRHRARPRHRVALLPPDGRPGRGRQHARIGLPLHRPTAARRARAVRGAAGLSLIPPEPRCRPSCSSTTTR